MIVHLCMHVQRFGPAPLFQTERYEAMNKFWRANSIASNRHAPSLDIMTAYNGQQLLRFMMSGAQWRTKDGFVQAGQGVRRLADSEEMRNLFGRKPRRSHNCE